MTPHTHTNRRSARKMRLRVSAVRLQFRSANNQQNYITKTSQKSLSNHAILAVICRSVGGDISCPPNTYRFGAAAGRSSALGRQPFLRKSSGAMRGLLNLHTAIKYTRCFRRVAVANVFGGDVFLYGIVMTVSCRHSAVKDGFHDGFHMPAMPEWSNGLAKCSSLSPTAI